MVGRRIVNRAELAAFAGRSIPDLAGAGTRLLIVGINPSLWSAATQAHFARPGNRFYPALALAGITPYVVDARDGYRPEDRRMLLDRGLGITNIVARATARADELSRDELESGAAALPARVEGIAPEVVAFLGVSSYRLAYRRPAAKVGLQEELLAGRPLWVVPNPSGLNAHETVASLAEAYAEPARAAGLELAPPSGP